MQCSVMALDGVTSSWSLKNVTNTCKRLRNSQTFGGISSSWKKLKTSNVFWSFFVCSNRNRSALVRDLLSYNSLKINRDLIVTSDLQTVNYLPGLIFFLTVQKRSY